MDNKFEPKKVEESLYKTWDSSGYFKPSGEGNPFCILIPPPNVTGTLHMGHAFNQTLMDTLIRFKRMDGENTLWQMGTDHAGIATQMLVERQLEQGGKNRIDLGRDEFISKVWEWKEKSGGIISDQIRRMGSSIDWSRDRFTMDPGYAEAVKTAFIRLYDQGLIYRGKRLVNWDPHLESAISDLEVENVEEKGHLWHLRYPLPKGVKTSSGENHLTVATTRPETLLGDSAVAVHPDDKRYADLIGQSVMLPLCDRKIPIIGDEYVDRDFGSGCVKITPAHDFNDYEVGERHDLEKINIFEANASLNDQVPDTYRGLSREEARERVLIDLEKGNFLEKVEDHKLMVPRGDRSNSIIEPYLTDQWFVKIGPLAEPAIAAVKDGQINFVPKQYENLYFSFMNDIRDWCISRQQWWGHQIPAFYDESGKVFVAENEEAARRKYNIPTEIKLVQDDDVLETWFSSSLWPIATMGWPEVSKDLDTYLPSQVLITGHDIIFFWVARMIMMTLNLAGKIPFRDVYIHGLVRDSEGQKMSKTKGNGLDPLDFVDGASLRELIEKRTTNLTQPQMAKKIESRTIKEFPDGIAEYGSDSLRFTFCALATTGRDVRFDVARIEGYRNFCNKLWNVAKFALSNTEDFAPGETVREAEVSDPINRWIADRTSHVIHSCRKALEEYRFDLYANHIYEFAWHEYCDWYIEMIKPNFWGDAEASERRRETQQTMLIVFETILKLAHPVMPFLTETLWQEIRLRSVKKPTTIMLERYPTSSDFRTDQQATQYVEWLKRCISSIRNIRGESQIKPNLKVPLLFAEGNESDKDYASKGDETIKRLANVESIKWLKSGEEAPPHALALLDDLKLLVPLRGFIDVESEVTRISKELKQNENAINRLVSKLENENFVTKAPKEVVSAEREKAESLHKAKEKLEEQLAQIKQFL